MDRSSRCERIPGTPGAVVEGSPGFMKRLIVGLATTVALSGGLGVAGLGLVS
jgi:hypothetical protein